MTKKTGGGQWVCFGYTRGKSEWQRALDEGWLGFSLQRPAGEQRRLKRTRNQRSPGVRLTQVSPPNHCVVVCPKEEHFYFCFTFLTTTLSVCVTDDFINKKVAAWSVMTLKMMTADGATCTWALKTSFLYFCFKSKLQILREYPKKNRNGIEWSHKDKVVQIICCFLELQQKWCL